MEFMRAYEWPGNVRELANFLQKCSVLFSGRTLSLDEIRPLMPNFEETEPKESFQASLWDELETDQERFKNDDSSSNNFPLAELGKFNDYFSKNQPLNLNQFLSDIEQNLVTSALQSSSGSVETAAVKLGLEPRELLEKIKLYAILNKTFQKEK